MTGLDKRSWDDVWKKHLGSYMKAPPRTGIAILTYCKSVHYCLEIATGSGRDAYFLCGKGLKVTAIDYAEKTIELLKTLWPGGEIDFQAQNAFNMSFRDKSFDLSFHNGFYVLFKNDDDIIKLIREQFRVTKKYMIFLVHNVLNEKLVKRFKRKAPFDPIYDIRFFSQNELLKLVRKSGISYKKIYFKKFGGFPDYFYTFLFKFKCFNVFCKPTYNVVPRLYQFVPWKYAERVMVIIEIEHDL